MIASVAILLLQAHTPYASEAALQRNRAVEVRQALASIKTVTGASALDRMKACRFRIQPTTSWVAKAENPNANFGLQPGDATINVEFDRAGANRLEARDNLARWFIRAGKLTPDTMWAREIQLGPYPINKDGAARC